MTAAVFAASERRTVPWRNGAGTTSDVASHPEGAAMSDFGWRISIADIARPAPFSSFPGVDRILVPITGGGISMRRGGAESELAPFEPVEFRGEEAVKGAPIGGASRDLNLMTRRGVFRGSVEVRRDERRVLLEASPRSTLVAVPVGGAAGLTTRTDGRDVTHLDPLDAVVVDGASAVELELGEATLVVFRIEAVGGSA